MNARINDSLDSFCCLFVPKYSETLQSATRGCFAQDTSEAGLFSSY